MAPAKASLAYFIGPFFNGPFNNMLSFFIYTFRPELIISALFHVKRLRQLDKVAFFGLPYQARAKKIISKTCFTCKRERVEVRVIEKLPSLFYLPQPLLQFLSLPPQSCKLAGMLEQTGGFNFYIKGKRKKSSLQIQVHNSPLFKKFLILRSAHSTFQLLKLKTILDNPISIPKIFNITFLNKTRLVQICLLDYSCSMTHHSW